jgi:hypothetical protein
MALPTGRQVDPLWVAFSGSGPGTIVSIQPFNLNLYDEAIMGNGIPSAILMYTVPVGKTLNIYSLVGWGDVCGEYVVKVDGFVKGGLRTSPTSREAQAWWQAPIIATTGQLVAVYGEQWDGTGKIMKLNLIGDLQ